MGKRRLVHGTARHHDHPDWAPLEALLGSETLCGHFMWMFDVQLEDGAILNAYKHRATRSYIHLTADQRTFVYVDSEMYRPVEPADAIEMAFFRWESMQPTAAERLALRSALARARGLRRAPRHQDQAPRSSRSRAP